MAKQLLYGEEARKKLKSGVDQIAAAVKTTLGPKGNNVALDKKWGHPEVTHDGVTVAKEIDLEDPFENMGAQLIKEAASKTNDIAGDGTTTSVVFAQRIIAEGLKNITAGQNAMALRKGIELGVEEAVKELKKIARPLKTRDEKAQVATISAADEEIGNLIADAMEKIGPNGVIAVEESKGLKMGVEYKEGLNFDRGYISGYFITNPEKLTAEIDDPTIFLTDKKLSLVDDIVPLLQKLTAKNKNIVIIADEIDGAALATLVVNKLHGNFNCVAVKAPGFGDRRKDILEDLAAVVGGQVFATDMGRGLDSITEADFGHAERIIVSKEETTIINGKGEKAEVEKRIKYIQAQLKESTSEFDKERLGERIAHLTGGIAILNVGAATEVELKEKKHRVEDAVQATKAAVDEGIIPGGGVAPIKARQALSTHDYDITIEMRIGFDIVMKALEEPLRQIVTNAGQDAGWILRTVEANKDLDYGFDVKKMEFTNLMKAGIVDPLKVTRSALQNAVSVAIMILTTEALVTDIPEGEAEQVEEGRPMPPRRQRK